MVKQIKTKIHFTQLIISLSYKILKTNITLCDMKCIFNRLYVMNCKQISFNSQATNHFEPHLTLNLHTLKYLRYHY